MEIVIASGKGGTGKTTVAVNLALSLNPEDVQLLDCDVEEPNAHLFLNTTVEGSWETGIPVPQIDLEKCTFCGRCAEVCAFNALAVFSDQVMVLNELCHGCGSCAYLCPENAISESERPIGTVISGKAHGFKIAYGRLNPGEAMSPPLINAVRKLKDPDRITIIDAPPGTSCPVVSAVKNCDYCLLVTEPTPFGLNDLALAHQMAEKLRAPCGVIINRCDIGDGEVEAYCFKYNLPVLLKIPFDRQLAEFYARGEPVSLSLPKWRSLFYGLFRSIKVAQKEGLRQ